MSVSHLAKHLVASLEAFCPNMYKNPREKLAIMASCLIETRSCNLMELAARLPIETERTESRYMWIERFLSTHTVKPDEVMKPLASQALSLAAQGGKTIVLCVDQTDLANTHGIAMLSVRIGERGLPLFWHTEPTAGNIPTNAYLPLLEKAYACIPEGVEVILMADRFFNAAALIKACRAYGWGWRLRIKQGRRLLQEDGEITGKELLNFDPCCPKPFMLGNAETYIGCLHESGHPEPWIIAMDQVPNKARVLDYGLRWGIEAMFSDCKTRGFNLEETHILRSDRLSKLILVVAVALHWAVAVGIQQKKNYLHSHPNLSPVQSSLLLKKGSGGLFSVIRV